MCVSRVSRAPSVLLWPAPDHRLPWDGDPADRERGPGAGAPRTPAGHHGVMIPFLVSEAIRRLRRRVPERRPGLDGGVPAWRLIGGELAYLARRGVVSPAVAMILFGLMSAAGVWVALGPAYPGPVAPVAARWLLGALVLGASLGVARTVPPRWRAVRRAVRRSRIAVAIVAFGAAVSLVKVGLHEVTPGPVLPASARWTVIVVSAVLAVALALSRDRRAGR